MSRALTFVDDSHHLQVIMQGTDAAKGNACYLVANLAELNIEVRTVDEPDVHY